MKLRLVRLNPLTLDPGATFLMGARQMVDGVFTQFPVRLEQLDPVSQSWEPVEFTNEFQSNEDNDTREVRPEVQVPVYNGSSRNKRGGGKSGGGQP